MNEGTQRENKENSKPWIVPCFVLGKTRVCTLDLASVEI